MIAMSTVSFDGTKYTVAPGESVLEALVRGGVNIPFSCRKGSCQVCMMQVVSGDPGPAATKGMRPALVEHRMFLPCSSHPTEDISVKRPDLAALYVEALVGEKTWVSESICKLSLEPETHIDWKPGQFINLRREDGVVRSYSIASIQEEDYFLSIHVKRVDNGVMSSWLLDEVDVGDTVRLQGPVGTCYYDPAQQDQSLILLGTGSGLSPLVGVCRDALRQGHRGKVVLHHGSRYIDGLYLREQLREMAASHANFEYHVSLTEGELEPGIERGRIVAHAFPEGADREGWMVYLCGVPEMVFEARVAAVRAGVVRADIRADPFEYSHKVQPDDKRKINALKPLPQLWEALDKGTKLSTILRSFYDEAFGDPRLAPFFRNVTKQRAIEKQYAFLADLFTGGRDYFGLRPFNAHHWMVISDDLFDYREAMLERAMRAEGLPEVAIRQWAGVHELFRREIVKGAARGMIIDGEEQPLTPPEQITVEYATVCDGCESEMPVGMSGTYVSQTGQLFCPDCGVPAARD